MKSFGNTFIPIKHAGLRAVQVIQALGLLGLIVNGALISPTSFTYDHSMIASLVAVAVTSMSIYLIDKRALLGRYFTVVGSAVAAALLAIDYFVLGAWTPIEQGFGHTFCMIAVLVQIAAWVGIALYIGLSAKVREILVLRMYETDPKTPAPLDLPFKERIRTWKFWRNVIFYFAAFSIIGHWAEMVFCQLIILGVVMGDYDPSNNILWTWWLYPFSAEGIAVALGVSLLYPVKEWLDAKTGGKTSIVLPVSFLINGLVCTAVDFGTGITVNQDYHLWDYRALPFNFMGQICLQNSLVYTVVATFLVWVVYPLMDRGIAKIPNWMANMLFLMFFSVYLFLAFLHFTGTV